MKDGRIYLSGQDKACKGALPTLLAERVGLEPYGAVTQTDSGPKKVTLLGRHRTSAWVQS